MPYHTLQIFGLPRRRACSEPTQVEGGQTAVLPCGVAQQPRGSLAKTVGYVLQDTSRPPRLGQAATIKEGIRL